MGGRGTMIHLDPEHPRNGATTLQPGPLPPERSTPNSNRELRPLKLWAVCSKGLGVPYAHPGKLTDSEDALGAGRPRLNITRHGIWPPLHLLPPCFLRTQTGNKKHRGVCTELWGKSLFPTCSQSVPANGNTRSKMPLRSPGFYG